MFIFYKLSYIPLKARFSSEILPCLWEEGIFKRDLSEHKETQQLVTKKATVFGPKKGHLKLRQFCSWFLMEEICMFTKLLSGWEQTNAIQNKVRAAVRLFFLSDVTHQASGAEVWTSSLITIGKRASNSFLPRQTNLPFLPARRPARSPAMCRSASTDSCNS